MELLQYTRLRRKKKAGVLRCGLTHKMNSAKASEQKTF